MCEFQPGDTVRYRNLPAPGDIDPQDDRPRDRGIVIGHVPGGLRILFWGAGDHYAEAEELRPDTADTDWILRRVDRLSYMLNLCETAGWHWSTAALGEVLHVYQSLLLHQEEDEPFPASDLTSVLVLYKGGGYPGCLWETNCAYIDEEGDVWPLFSSGHWGIDDYEDVPAVLEDEDTQIFRTGDQDELEDFADEATPDMLYRCALELRETPIDLHLEARCAVCGHLSEVEDCEPADEHGCGGIATAHEVMVCSDCFTQYWDEDAYSPREEAADKAYFKFLEENPPETRQVRRA